MDALLTTIERRLDILGLDGIPRGWGDTNSIACGSCIRVTRVCSLDASFFLASDFVTSPECPEQKLFDLVVLIFL
jgi:hypothetical protein